MATVYDVSAIYAEAITARTQAEKFYKENKSKIPAGADSVLWDVDKWFFPNYENFKRDQTVAYKDAARLAVSQYRAALSKMKSSIPTDWVMWGGIAALAVVVAVVFSSNKQQR